MNTSIKKSFLALTVVLATSFNIFAQQNKDAAVKMLEDEQKKEAIFSAIMNDKQLKEDFMIRMMADKGSRNMMMKNMMNKIEKDSSMCMMMGSMMMEDGHMMDMMMGNMMDKAEDDPAMCKKMCMMMMDGDKKMDMMDNMKNSEEPAGHENSQGKSNMQNHMEDSHQSNNKK